MTSTTVHQVVRLKTKKFNNFYLNLKGNRGFNKNSLLVKVSLDEQWLQEFWELFL